MTTYTQTDVTNQRITIASAQLASSEAQATLATARNQLVIIQNTIALQAAQAAATPTPSPSSTPSPV